MPSLSRQSCPSACPGAATSSQPSRCSPGLHEDRVSLVADERSVDGALSDELLGDVVGHSVELEPLQDPLGPGGIPPDELALRVVERALVDGRTRQLVQIGGRPDVVGVEVRHEDAGDAPSRLLELGRPALLRIGEADSRVDEVHPSSPGRR